MSIPGGHLSASTSLPDHSSTSDSGAVFDSESDPNLDAVVPHHRLDEAGNNISALDLASDKDEAAEDVEAPGMRMRTETSGMAAAAATPAACSSIRGSNGRRRPLPAPSSSSSSLQAPNPNKHPQISVVVLADSTNRRFEFDRQGEPSSLDPSRPPRRWRLGRARARRPGGRRPRHVALLPRALHPVACEARRAGQHTAGQRRRKRCWPVWEEARRASETTMV